MDCDRFIELSKKWHGDVCLFGSGECGATWGYELIKEVGFDVSYYVDNYRHGGMCNGIPIYSPEYLLQNSERVLCIITIMGDRGAAVLKQLGDMRIKHIFWLHDGDDIRLELPQYLDERGEKEISNRLLSLMDDRVYLTKRFKERTGQTMDWENPRTFNEKLQWLKIYDRKPIYTNMVDKASVKDLVAEKIGEKHIIPTLGVYDSFDEIDFEALPDRFVLKCTHDSGSILICKDKGNFDIENAKRKLESARRKNYFWPDREWPYYGVPRRIIAEKYIESDSDVLEVYKIFNFMGKPELIQIIQDDKTDHETIDYFDTSWNLLDLRQNFPNSKIHCPRPVKLNEMLALAEILSRDLPFIRTDFYISKNEIFFSEFTFYTDSGCEPFHPSEWDIKLGDLIRLPN